jgi:hypothetical protein
LPAYFHGEPGNIILADRVFNFAHNIGIHGAMLNTPAFIRGKEQLPQKEAFERSFKRTFKSMEKAMGILNTPS